MTVVVYQLDPASERVYQQHAGRAPRLLQMVDDALVQGTDETAAHLQNKYLRGGNPNVKRSGKPPLAVRSTALVTSVGFKKVGTWQTIVGSIKGVAKHARMLLLDGVTTITPKVAKFLWIPIGDNRSKRGGAKISPREALSKTGPRGGRLLRIFMSSNKNLVAFLRDAKGGTYTKGKNKGRQRGRLLFVLKKRVEVEGTNALPLAVEDKRSRVTSLLQLATNTALEGN